ncbi:hypothetical protein JYU34_009022 [Plutella xylostella]|uniref:RRM domain-containing protein n=1 Tax=Plutella xylostella TaxID=51655 RepID=A0ABQ7QMD5_PLUXY|nr:RNA-binding protein 7 [Plutella xylostella]KAG7306392.1 hypothetical protein JYU34_009022 [Plutella xylostella]
MIEENNKTLWCGNLPEQATEELLYELFLQAGPLEKVTIPRDRDGRQKNFAFVTFCHDVSVPYAIQLFRGTSLFHRTLTLQCRAGMALLPPPIRCTTLDQSFDFLAQTNVKQQFADMTRNINEHEQRLIYATRQLQGGELVMASLQGNWSAPRHHPYRKDDRRHGKDDYKSRDGQNRDGNATKHWRDRRNHSNGGRYNNRNTRRRD